MERKQRLFIYDRKEMGVLILLGVMVAFFAFTLGVHLGKRVPPATGGASAEAQHTDGMITVGTVSDQIPRREEGDGPEVGRAASAEAVREVVGQALHDEVQKTGIRLEKPRQVDLPDQMRAAAQEIAKRAEPTLEGIPAARRPAPDGKFTLQVGSYSGISEVRERADAFEALGLMPIVRSAEIQGKGTWYRIYLGGYASKEEAENAGDRYRRQKIIDSFIVSHKVD